MLHRIDSSPEHPLITQVRMALRDTNLNAPRPIATLPELPESVTKMITGGITKTFREAAVLVPIVRREEPTVLLTRRADHLAKHAGQVSFVGGGRDAEDETIVSCALREAREEIGLDVHVDILGYLDDFPTFTRYVVTPVVGVISPNYALSIDAGEVADVFEVPLAALLDETQWTRKWHEWIGNETLPKLPYLALEWEGRTIWGATAGMIGNLRQKVKLER
mgnify:FL=1